jgi:3-mercaptopyruvate sulfurtransferase SseA
MQAVRLLRRLGYRRLGHYGGGIQAWRKAGLPFDTGHDRSVHPEEYGAEGPASHP